MGEYKDDVDGKTSDGLFLSEVKVFTRDTNEHSDLVAFCKVVLNRGFLLDCFELHQTTEGKYYLKFPVQDHPKNGRDGYVLYHPVNAETNRLILDAVVARLKSYTLRERIGEERQDNAQESGEPCTTR
jgi:hypothetical protein